MLQALEERTLYQRSSLSSKRPQPRQSSWRKQLPEVGFARRPLACLGEYSCSIETGSDSRRASRPLKQARGNISPRLQPQAPKAWHTALLPRWQREKRDSSL